MRKDLIYISVPVILAVGLILTAPGCGKSSDKTEVLASIDDTEITVADFNSRIENLPERYRGVVKNRRSEYLQEYINDTLLYREAMRKNLHKDKELLRLLEAARKKILVARLLQDEVDNAIEINDEDVAAFYDENSARYMTPEIMRVSHILVPSRVQANEILENLTAGESFEDLARAKSVDPTAQRAGDIGYFPKGQLMPEFEGACAQLGVGEISGVVKTKLGYHIIKLTDRRPPEPRPIEKVTDDIKSRLYAAKRQELFNQLLRKLRDESDIQIYEEAFPVLEEDTETVIVEENETDRQK